MVGAWRLDFECAVIDAGIFTGDPDAPMAIGSHGSDKLCGAIEGDFTRCRSKLCGDLGYGSENKKGYKYRK
jgi:hypothetical protein